MIFSDAYAHMKTAVSGFYAPLHVAVKAVAILILAYIIVRLGKYLIGKAVKKQQRFSLLDEKRLNTMGAILSSVLTYGVYTIAIITILTEVTGILELGTVLTAAGIGGVAVGLGAQSLIKDIISGFFILIENQYGVGDMVTIGDMTGTVEDIEIRLTRLRNYNGDLYIIPNGEIKVVTNHTRGFKRAVVDIPVSYESNIGEAISTADAVCRTIPGEPSIILEGPDVVGAVASDKDCVIIRVTAKTVPGEQWALEREIRKRIVEEFNRKGVKFAHRMMTMGES